MDFIYVRPCFSFSLLFRQDTVTTNDNLILFISPLVLVFPGFPNVAISILSLACVKHSALQLSRMNRGAKEYPSRQYIRLALADLTGLATNSLVAS